MQTFLTKKLLNRRQARWAIELSEYNFEIVFRPGAKNGKADALTRRSGDLPKEGDNRGRPVDSVLRPENFSPSFSSEITDDHSASSPVKIHNFSISVITAWDDPISVALKNDPLGQSILKALNNHDQRHPKVALSECEVRNGLLLVNGLLYVPDNEKLQAQILSSRHDHPAAGHPGRSATYELITRDFWWPGMRKTIARYVKNCDTCARIKPARHAPYGYLKPLSIPQRRWESISLDFIVGLPESSGYNSVLVVVDRLSKMAHFIPTNDNVTSEGTAKLFCDWIFRLHGLPDSMVSDRGTTFTSDFSRALCKLVKIEQKFSTAYHPETDGQTERVNGILEQYLRGYCNYQQDN